jgi:hypothetical protein
VESSLNPIALLTVCIFGLIIVAVCCIIAAYWLGFSIKDLPDIIAIDIITNLLVKIVGNDEDRKEAVQQFMQKLKIYITLGQILSSMKFVFNAIPPVNFRKLTNIFSVLVKLFLVIVNINIIITIIICVYRISISLRYLESRVISNMILLIIYC